MKGGYLDTSLIYKAEVVADNKTSTYIGLASNTFKERYSNHISSFKNVKYRESTTLSNHIWDLKDGNKQAEIKWTKIANAPTYNPSSKKCMLCILEKTLILTSKHTHPLNKRTEIMNKCRHRRKFLLSNFQNG